MILCCAIISALRFSAAITIVVLSTWVKFKLSFICRELLTQFACTRVCRKMTRSRTIVVNHCHLWFVGFFNFSLFSFSLSRVDVPLTCNLLAMTGHNEMQSDHYIVQNGWARGEREERNNLSFSHFARCRKCNSVYQKKRVRRKNHRRPSRNNNNKLVVEYQREQLAYCINFSLLICAPVETSSRFSWHSLSVECVRIVCNLIKIEVGQLHSCELYICEAQRRRKKSDEAHEKKKSTLMMMLMLRAQNESDRCNVGLLRSLRSMMHGENR